MTGRFPLAEEWGMLFTAPLSGVPKKEHHEAAHRLLRETLPAYAAYRNISSPDGAMDFREMGKPYFPAHPEVHFNLSHCDGLAVCLYSEYECGADCESIRTYKPRTAERVCSQEELAALGNAQDKDFLFTRLWTLKEAYVKAIGIGISYPLREVSFAFDGDRILSNRKDASFMQFLLCEHIVSVCVLHPMPEQKIIQIS